MQGPPPQTKQKKPLVTYLPRQFSKYEIYLVTHMNFRTLQNILIIIIIQNAQHACLYRRNTQPYTPSISFRVYYTDYLEYDYVHTSNSPVSHTKCMCLQHIIYNIYNTHTTPNVLKTTYTGNRKSIWTVTFP